MVDVGIVFLPECHVWCPFWQLEDGAEMPKLPVCGTLLTLKSLLPRCLGARP